MTDSRTAQPTIDLVKEKQKDFKLKALFWQGVHFFLGGISVSLAAVLALESVPSLFPSEDLAALVAGSAALSTFLRPDARAKKFHAARSILRRARTKFEHDNDPLVEALNEADELVLQE